MNYNGNKIYDYITQNNYQEYFYLAGYHWMLIYGDKTGIPKLFTYVNKVDNLNLPPTKYEKEIMKTCSLIAAQLKLPFVWIRYANNAGYVHFYRQGDKKIYSISYDKLRDCFESYGVIESGLPKKNINQYSSSKYHEWQRQNLGRITVTDIDLIKFSGSQIEAIIELKRSKIPLNDWKPYINDYPNFTLTINTIVISHLNIPFYLYYSLLRDGVAGQRIEDISTIKWFEFVIPKSTIDCKSVQYRCNGFSSLPQLL